MFEILKDICLIAFGGTVGFFTAALCAAAGKEEEIGKDKI